MLRALEGQRAVGRPARGAGAAAAPRRGVPDPARRFVDNKASNRYTVVEVNARDRAALLFELARAIYVSRAVIHSAHIATYGERAVDVFYLTDLSGAKIEGAARLKALQARLLEGRLASPSRDRKARGRRKEKGPPPSPARAPSPACFRPRSGSGR